MSPINLTSASGLSTFAAATGGGRTGEGVRRAAGRPIRCRPTLLDLLHRHAAEHVGGAESGRRQDASSARRGAVRSCSAPPFAFLQRVMCLRARHVHGYDAAMPQGTDAAQTALKSIAHRAMLENGLQPDFPPAAIGAVERQISGPAVSSDPKIRDLRRAAVVLDRQRRFAGSGPAVGGRAAGRTTCVRILVAVADVDATVAAGSALDAARPRQHDLGVHRGADLRHAARSGCRPI